MGGTLQKLSTLGITLRPLSFIILDCHQEYVKIDIVEQV